LVDAARQLLHRPLTTAVVDVMCEVPKHESVGSEFAAEDLPDPLFRDTDGIRLVACLAPPGDAVSTRLAAVLDAQDPDLRMWSAHALTRRLPLPDPVLLASIAPLHDPSPGVAERLSWILKTQRPLSADVQRILERQAPELAAQIPAADLQRSRWCRWCDES